MSRFVPLVPGYEWGSWDETKDVIRFPSKASLLHALQEIDDCMHRFDASTPYVDCSGDPFDAQMERIFYDDKHRKVVIGVKEWCNDDFPSAMQTTVLYEPSGSAVFRNVMTYFFDSITYSNSIQNLYHFTYPSKKIELSPLLLGTLTQNQTTSISRFFRHSLCERQVLNLVRMF